MSNDDTPQEAFDASIAEILAEWGQPLSFSRGQLATAMEALYRAELEFPPTWPEHRRETFITNHADLDVGELSTQFDDLIESVTNDYGLRYGALPHPDDASDMIRTARLDALNDILQRRLDYELPNEIEAHSAEDAD
ncbi:MULTISPECIES: hypothetical protein [Mycobacteriaceae]|uniref:hypothetical protein n=1 Tax=Mycobacteriaceae TaxID=1762 RepID=UPI001878C298|nr:hypothetical protein [Mycobacterium barrassiae]MBE5472695.1 hypothetical protein [Mycobacteroides abscessus]MCV7298050.1 hypothetical protein [Mycobacterium barrassiae]